MYPTNLDAINLEVINFIDIISNIKNMDFQQSPLPPIFRTFNATDTKTSKGSSNNEHSDQPPRKKPKKKDQRSKMNPHLANGDSTMFKTIPNLIS